MGSLRGRVALVTGGASGIGAAIASALLEQGCRVTFTYLHSDPEPVRSCAPANQVLALQADLTQPLAVEAVVRETVQHFGGIDVLVNNVGDLVERRQLEDMDLDFFRKVMAVNMDSMMLVTQAAVPHLKSAKNGASIVNVSSLAGRKGGHLGSLAYATAKGAVLTFTRALATELASSRIRANAIAPGLILGTNFHAVHTTPESAELTIKDKIPLGRAGSPEDVARVAVFLAGEYSGFITGATVDVNGGQYMA